MVRGGTMNPWMWPVSLVGILSTAVVFGTDMFFLTIGRPALRLGSPSAGTEVMGFLHMFADARMPVWASRPRGCGNDDHHDLCHLSTGHRALMVRRWKFYER